jgi:hypothetical protein
LGWLMVRRLGLGLGLLGRGAALLLEDVAEVWEVLACLGVSLINLPNDFPLLTCHLVGLRQQESYGRASDEVAQDLPRDGLALPLQLILVVGLSGIAGLALMSRRVRWKRLLHRSAIPWGGVRWELSLWRCRREGWCRDRWPPGKGEPCLGR